MGGRPTSLVAAGGRVWVGVAASPGGHRGGTFVIASIRRFQTVDPAIFASVEPPQFLGLAYDTLVTFNHTGGADGLQLVPDLALTLPTVRDGGRTYAFRLRPGIRYSDGRTVRAGDFRRAVERLFALLSPASRAYSGISGAAACSALACDLSRGIVTDDAQGTIVFHLTAPDPEFLYGLTFGGGAPVPPGTPGYDAGPAHPIPGTGPYRIARADRTGFLFVRNRFFREWSHAAQPQGNPDRIVWRERAVAARGGGRGAGGAGRLARRARPALRPSPARDPGARATALASAVRRRVRGAQQRSRPVRRRARPASPERRGRPARDRRAVWRSRVRRADVPAARARPARLPALLPLHGTPGVRRRLRRPGPGPRAPARRAVGHPGHARRRLGPGRRRLHPARPRRLPRPRPALARLPHDASTSCRPAR